MAQEVQDFVSEMLACVLRFGQDPHDHEECEGVEKDVGYLRNLVTDAVYPWGVNAGGLLTVIQRPLVLKGTWEGIWDTQGMHVGRT